jgi:hypothetical protein
VDISVKAVVTFLAAIFATGLIIQILKPIALKIVEETKRKKHGATQSEFKFAQAAPQSLFVLASTLAINRIDNG